MQFDNKLFITLTKKAYFNITKTINEPLCINKFNKY